MAHWAKTTYQASLSSQYSHKTNTDMKKIVKKISNPDVVVQLVAQLVAQWSKEAI